MSYERGWLLVVALAGCSLSAAQFPPQRDLGAHDGAAAHPPNDLAGAPAPSPSSSPDDLGGVSPDLAPSGPADAILRIHYPVGSHAMALRGGTAPLNWTTGVALTAAPDGTFSYTFPLLAAPVELKPLLDDTTWSRGANYIIHPGQTYDVYPHFTATKGTVKALFNSFPSKYLSYNQRVWVYLPSSYDENTLATYPVLYMHDGQNLFDPTLAFGGNEWKVDETLDAASDGDVASGGGLIREIIVIGPEAGPGRIPEYTPTTDPTTPGGGNGDNYLRMLVEELKPQVDAMLRTQKGRETTGILGSSLGGLISAYAGCTHADTYGLIGVMSPSTWWNNNVIIGDVAGMMPAPKRPMRVYVDNGDTGPSNDDVTQTAMLYQAYLQDGYTDGSNAEHIVQHLGQHSEVYWAMRFPGAAAFLFGPR